MIRKALAGLVYGDALMLFNNQTKAYEINKGESDALVEQWIQRLSDEMEKRQRLFIITYQEKS